MYLSFIHHNVEIKQKYQTIRLVSVSKMMKLALKEECSDPTHIVKCSPSLASAFVLSVKSNTYTKFSWSNNTEDDTEKIEETNSKLPPCEEITSVITGKLSKKLVHIYLSKHIVSFEDEIYLPMPDAVFLQRVSPQTKTFDMILFYGKKHEIISVVDKSDLDVIRNWYPHKIYSCGADPLPMSSVTKYLKNYTGEDMYEHLFNQLFAESDESSCSEYEQMSSESDDDYISDEDDEIQAEESDYVSEEDGEYVVQPDTAYESEDSEYESEPKKKKIKL